MNFRKFIVSVLTAASLASLLTTAGCGKDAGKDKNQETATDAPAATDSLVNTEKEDFSNKVKVILMAGQSNMAGATYNPTKYDVGEDTYKKYRKGFENIQIMFSSGVRGMPENQWNTSRTVFQKVKPGQGAASMKNLFGPELGLAEYLTEKYPDEKFYLVKHALGGALIDDYLGQTDPNLDCYSQLKKQFDYAITEIKEETDKEIVIVAICWMQGESEGGTLASANLYKDKSLTLINKFRNDYKDYAPAGGIAWIDAGISDSSLWPAHETINNAKQEIAAGNDKNYYIDTIGAQLGLGPDNAHYDVPGAIKLGRLFGEKVEEVITKG